MYTAAQISGATGAALANVQQSWPGLVTALNSAGINTHLTRIGAIATVARETGVFLPIEEEGGWDYYVRELGAAEAAYHGRGFVQLTWSYNYRQYGQELGLDLLHHPELALQPVPAARILVRYFVDRGIPAMCEAQQWGNVQTAVNGGWIGWNVFIGVVQRLLALPEPADLPPITTVAVAGPLYQGPIAKPGTEAIGPTHKPVTLTVGQRVVFTPDPRTKQEVTTHWAHLQVKDSPVHGWFQRASLLTVYP